MMIVVKLILRICSPEVARLVFLPIRATKGECCRGGRIWTADLTVPNQEQNNPTANLTVRLITEPCALRTW